MSRPRFPRRTRYRFIGITAKASRGSLWFTAVLAPRRPFHQQRPKLENEHDDENEQDSGERDPGATPQKPAARSTRCRLLRAGNGLLYLQRK